MLKVFFGETKGAIYNTSMYFDNVFEDDWLMSDIAKEIVKDIDKSEVIGGRVVDSPVLGLITPRELSGGVKTLLLMINEPETVVNISNCGDNCAKWILKIAEDKDIMVNLYHTMNFGDTDFSIQIVNSGEIIHNMSEMLDAKLKYLKWEDN